MNNRKVDNMADRISEEISEGLAVVMKPVFENLAKEISGLVTGLEDRQKENMRIMADAFLQEMAKASGSMFNNIAKDSADICRMQSETVRELAEAVERMAADRAAIQKISGDNSRTAAELAGLVSRLDDKIDSLARVSDDNGKLAAESSDRIRAEMELYERLEQSSGRWSRQLAECNEMVAATSEDANEKINAGVERAMHNLEKCAARLESITKDIESSYEKMNSSMHVMMKDYRETVSRDIAETFKAFDINMSEIVKTLGTAVTDIAEAADRIPKALKGSIDSLRQPINR